MLSPLGAGTQTRLSRTWPRPLLRVLVPETCRRAFGVLHKPWENRDQVPSFGRLEPLRPTHSSVLRVQQGWEDVPQFKHLLIISPSCRFGCSKLPQFWYARFVTALPCVTRPPAAAKPRHAHPTRRHKVLSAKERAPQRQTRRAGSVERIPGAVPDPRYGGGP